MIKMAQIANVDSCELKLISYKSLTKYFSLKSQNARSNDASER